MKSNMINAGKYNRRIIIYKVVKPKDSAGFPITTQQQTILGAFMSTTTCPDCSGRGKTFKRKCHTIILLNVSILFNYFFFNITYF